MSRAQEEVHMSTEGLTPEWARTRVAELPRPLVQKPGEAPR
jgi:hypothetical protein